MKDGHNYDYIARLFMKADTYIKEAYAHANGDRKKFKQLTML